MAQAINGYHIIGELKNDHSGYAKWGFARKNGIEVFIKEFLTPIYPLDETVLSKAQIEKKRQICADFYRVKKEFYDQLNKCSTGNIVTVLDFFRFGSRYYMVTEKVDAATLAPEHISKFNLEQKLLVMKIIVHCVNTLHKHGIVHADIKPDNILLKRTKKGAFTAKIIDFDSSFLESNPPQTDEEFQGDMVYLSPEAFLFMCEEDIKLSTKVDVFALGILFHQYLTGEMPGFDRDKYDYIYSAVLDESEIIIDKTLPENLREMLAKMLLKEADERATLDWVFAELGGRIMPTMPEKSHVAGTVSGGTYSHLGTSGAFRPGSDDLGGGTSSGDTLSASTPPEKRGTMNGFFQKADDLL